MKSHLFITLVMFPLYIHADMDPGPDEIELSKAPDWPKEYTNDKGRNEKCMQPSAYQTAISRLNKNEKDSSFIFKAPKYVDLNQDGICEVILLQSYACGTGGCGTSVGKLEGDEIKFIGNSQSYFKLLEPFGGWLQMEGWGRSGMTHRTRSLYRFNGKEYALYRTDAWDSELSGKMMYQKTVYNRHYDK